MRAHYFQHVFFEGLAHIETCLHAAGYEITRTPFYESTDLPRIEDIDFLVIMGGPMSVHDGERYPWLAMETDFIRRMIESGKPVLGICLGAQLIARALGAGIYPNPQKEIGWFSIKGEPQTESSDFHFPREAEVFHWHGETFDLPPGSVRLASSEACRNQAFQVGTSVIGLQFHLETTPESARLLVEHCRDELVPSPFVQTEERILSAGPDTYRGINRMMEELVSFLTR